MYEVDQDYINFLKGEGRFAYRLKNETDKQVYSHFGLEKENTDKYIGVIIVIFLYILKPVHAVMERENI